MEREEEQESKIIIAPQIIQFLSRGLYPLNEKISRTILKHVKDRIYFRFYIRIYFELFYFVRFLLSIIYHHYHEEKMLPVHLERILKNFLFYTGDFTLLISNSTPLNIYMFLVTLTAINISLTFHFDRKTEKMANIMNNVFTRKSICGINPETHEKIEKGLLKFNKYHVILVWCFTLCSFSLHVGELS